MFNFKYFTEIKSLFFPIAMAIILSNISSFIDTAMVSNYNVLGISAINSANQIMVAFGPVFFGIMTGVNIFTVQYYARGEYDNLKHLVGIAITFMFPFAIFLVMIMATLPEEIITFFIKDNQEVVQLGVDYFVFFKYYILLLPVEMLFMYQFRAIKQPKIPLRMGVIQTILNVLLNWMFIFGNLGAPELGILGAGLATFLARFITLIFYLSYSISIKVPFLAKLSELFAYDRKLFKKVLIATLPLIILELGFGFSRVLIAKVFALTGVIGFTAYSIAARTSFLINALVIATANVSGILVGGALSKEDKDLDIIIKDLFKFMFLAATAILILSIFVLPLVIKLFGVSEQYYSMIRLLLISNGIYMALRVFVSSYISMLKAGADNYFVIFLDAGITYLVAIPLVYIGFFIFDLGIVVLVSLLILEMVVKVIGGHYRFSQNKWRVKL